MTPSPLSRVAGPIALVAGALVVVTRLVIALTTPRDAEALAAYVLTPTHAINSVASIVAFALLALALVAGYEREANEAATAGVIAFGAALVGIVFMAGDWWFEAFAVPRMGELVPQLFDTFVGGRLQFGGVSSFVLFGIGWAMFGVASMRARVFPGGLAATILLSGILSGVPIGVVYLSGQAILGLTIMWLGAWMLRSPVIASAAVEPSRGPHQPAA
jgi:hypothetical protein